MDKCCNQKKNKKREAVISSEPSVGHSGQLKSEKRDSIRWTKISSAESVFGHHLILKFFAKAIEKSSTAKKVDLVN